MAAGKRVGIVGMGHVGTHVANSLILQGIVDELVLSEPKEERLAAEVQDLGDALSFCPHDVAIRPVGGAYEKLASCDIVVNAMGDVALARESRDGELQFTPAQARDFVPRVEDAGFEGIWLTISNPCDVVATLIHRLAHGPSQRVLGTGTALDSARVRHTLAREVGLAQQSIQAYMLGEHGFSQFVAWSGVAIGGIPLDVLKEREPARFDVDRAALEETAVHAGYVTMAGKHCTEYAVANAAAQIIRAILCDEHRVVACSTLLTGEFGEEDIYASLPCVVGAQGVEEVLCPDLPPEEVERFHASCAHIRGNIAQLDWFPPAR